MRDDAGADGDHAGAQPRAGPQHQPREDGQPAQGAAGGLRG